jgi:hypothetical protein
MVTTVAMTMLAHWRAIAVGVVLMAAVTYRGVLIYQRNAARAESVSLGVHLGALKIAETACEAAVANQNRAVDAMRSTSKRLAEVSANRTANVSAAAAKTTALENDRAMKTLQTPIAADCPGAIKWGNLRAIEIGKW